MTAYQQSIKLLVMLRYFEICKVYSVKIMCKVYSVKLSQNYHFSLIFCWLFSSLSNNVILELEFHELT